MIKRGALFCVSLAFSLMLLISLAMTGSHVFASEQPAISSSSSQSIVNSTSVNNQSKQNQNSTTDVHTAVSVVSSSHQPQDVSDRITNLTVVERDSKKTQSIYNDDAYVTVSGTFSDARGKIQGSDTIHVNWPNSGQAYVNSYVGGKDLYVNGTMVGHYTVDQTGATLTFNDKINDLQNVSGNFSFDVEVRNTDEQNQTIQITAGSTVASIPVKGITKGSSQQPSDNGWRGSKVGMMITQGDHNALAWGIYLNSVRPRLAVTSPVQILFKAANSSIQIQDIIELTLMGSHCRLNNSKPPTLIPQLKSTARLLLSVSIKTNFPVKRFWLATERKSLIMI